MSFRPATQLPKAGRTDSFARVDAVVPGGEDETRGQAFEIPLPEPRPVSSTSVVSKTGVCSRDACIPTLDRCASPHSRAKMPVWDGILRSLAMSCAAPL
jgi:hypothetical protein